MTDFDWSVIEASLPFIWKGFLFSANLTVVAMLGGIFIGTLLALARLSGGRVLSNASALYVNAMRSTPLLMVILWFFLIAPIFVGPLGERAGWNCALITFTLFEAAYYSEIIRAGIQSIPRGQVGAGYAVGLTYPQAMWYVVLPQAFRNMLPVLLTQTIILFQDTTLVYAIGLKDLLKAAQITGTNYYRPVEMYLFVTVIYFAVCFSLSMLVKYTAKRVAIIR